MNKTFKKILSASFICFLLLSAFTACSKDDEGQPEKKVATVEVAYRITLTDATKSALQDAFDLTVSYWNMDGELVSMPFSSGVEWTMALSLIEFPADFGIGIRITPKENLSAFTQETVRDLDLSYSVSANSMAQDGEILGKGVSRMGVVKKKDMPVLEFAESDNPVITGELYYKVDKEGYIVSK